MKRDAKTRELIKKLRRENRVMRKMLDQAAWDLKSRYQAGSDHPTDEAQFKFGSKIEEFLEETYG